MPGQTQRYEHSENLTVMFELTLVHWFGQVEAETPNNEDYTPGEERTFSTVIENLRGSYSSDKMSEISTSFCFICLLHLANEQGLEIEPARFDDGADAVGVLGEAEGVEATGGRVLGATIDTSNDRVIGELQALRIRKVCLFPILTDYQSLILYYDRLGPGSCRR